MTFSVSALSLSQTIIRIIEQCRMEGTLEDHLVLPFMGKGA